MQTKGREGVCEMLRGRDCTDKVAGERQVRLAGCLPGGGVCLEREAVTRHWTSGSIGSLSVREVMVGDVTSSCQFLSHTLAGCHALLVWVKRVIQ